MRQAIQYPSHSHDVARGHGQLEVLIHALEPAVRPLGFDWKIGVGLVRAFAAREVFVSTMSVVYNVGEVDDAETGSTSGLVDRMRREFKVEANVGKPQVAYRETITKLVEKVDYTHKKQTGGSGQFAKVLINLEPATDVEGGYEFENKVTGGVHEPGKLLVQPREPEPVEVPQGR
mgnify:CR=1 FL=1